MCLVLEAQPEPGGAVKSAERFPGYASELFSAFYRLSAVRRRCMRLNCTTTDCGDRARPLRLATPGPPTMRTRR